MRAKLDNPKAFSEAIAIISELVTEVKIRFNEEGMSIVAIDPANVAMVNFRIKKENFSEYSSGNEVLGINLDNLKAILRRAKNASTLIMENSDSALNIEVLDRVKRNFSLALIEVDSEEKKPPKLEFLTQVQMSPSDLVDSIEDCLIVADSCSFIASPDKFIIEASGLNSAKSEFSTDEVKLISGESRSKYSLEYLQKFVKAAKIADQVFVNFSTDTPCKVEFKNNSFELAFILAPRV